MKKTTSNKIFQRVFVILSGSAFILFSIVGVLRMSTSTSSNQNPVSEELSPEAQLRQQAEGYQSVLAREPDNPFAIEQLLTIHLQLGELELALPLAEKLLSLQPDNVRYQEVVSAIQQGIAQQQANHNQSSEDESSPVETTEEKK